MEPTTDGRHLDAAVEEWVFSAWTSDGALGVWSGHRIVGRIAPAAPIAWYWAAVARLGHPLLHVLDVDVPMRANPFIIKGEQLWAEHVCEAPMEQWSIGNETYASALDDPDDALDRAFGLPTPIAFDLEWYATAPPAEIEHGYVHDGVVHGVIELQGEPTIELAEVPARRWHRWRLDDSSLAPLALPEVRAHTDVRAPFRFPGGDVLDAVLSPSGWARRARRR